MAQLFENDAEAVVTRVHQSENLLRRLYSNEEVEPASRVSRLGGLKIILVVSLLSFTLLGGTTLFKFNNFIILRENVRAKQGNLESGLQRRANLVNNLVKLTLSHAELEHAIFSHTAEARTRIVEQADTNKAADGGIEPPTSAAFSDGMNALAAPRQSVTDGTEVGAPSAAKDAPAAWLQSLQGMANSGLGATLSRLLAVVEQYPTVRSSETYLELIQSLVELEDNVAQRREQHHQALYEYNAAISNFPWHWLAKLTKFSRMDYYAAEATVRLPPVITEGIYQQLTPLESARGAQP